MRRYTCVAIVAMVSGAWGISVVTSAEPRDPMREFMRAKLKHSQAAIEGLVLNDWEKVGICGIQPEIPDLNGRGGRRGKKE